MDLPIATNTVAAGTGDTAPVTGTPGDFTSGTPGSVPATIVPGYWLNLVAYELRNIVIAAGLTPLNSVKNQVITAIQALIASASHVPSRQRFTSSGTFTVPAGVTVLNVTLFGGGGGSGAISSVGSGAAGGGGGGGYSTREITGLTPGATIAVTVGAGGTGAGAGGSTAGGNGGTSSFGSYLSATGGGGGYGNGNGSGGAGGTGSGGDFNQPGTNGAGAGSTSSANVGGQGGSSPFGGVGGLSSNFGAQNGSFPGGGGGGPGSGSTTNGTSGAPGFVLVEW